MSDDVLVPEAGVFTLGLVGLVGGLITGISPCVLPVLPVIFLSGGAQGARTANETTPESRGRHWRPFAVVAGLALSFSVFTLLGTLVLRSLPVPQDVIRWAGLVVLVLLGVGMIAPRFEELLERPFSRLPQPRVHTNGSGFLLGLALGAVYVPCAGPVLAAITVAGATGRIGASTVTLTVAFAIGTSIPLLIFALSGRRVGQRVRQFRTHQRRIRVLAGGVVIALAVALAFNVTDRIQRAIPDYTSALNSSLDSHGGRVTESSGSDQNASLASCVEKPTGTLENCGVIPPIAGIDTWLNTTGGAAVSASALRGRVVLVDFWAYSCINCQRAIPHVEAWYAAYRDVGLEVIGIHTPEYAFEQVPSNVASGIRRLGITYPVALDNHYVTWDDFANTSWPAEYLVDAAGEIRHVTIGEGEYANTESLIRQLLAAAHPNAPLPPRTDVADTTPRSAAQTQETYLGAEHAVAFSGGVLRRGDHAYAFPDAVPADEFALAGHWSVGNESLVARKDAAIALNFVANDVYLDVGGTGTLTATLDGRTTTFPVSGAPDIYAIVHGDEQVGGVLSVSLSPGLRAYSFTFG